MLAVHEALSPVSGAPFMLAATFGNVYGVYKPVNLVLTPTILKDGQDAVPAKHGEDARFQLVSYSGSGSSQEEIRQTLGYDVIKMNLDTDTQYTFTGPVVDHILANYEGELKVEGEVGNKKMYDPRGWLKKGKDNMSARVIQSCQD